MDIQTRNRPQVEEYRNGQDAQSHARKDVKIQKIT